MKKLTILVISLMTSASAYGQSTTNSIYIDQVGDGSEITLTQEGQSNKIGEGESVTDRFVLEGGGQKVTVRQDGNSNVIKGSVVNANDIAYDTTVTGDGNILEYDQGTIGSVAGSNKTLTVEGVNNTLTFNQGTTVSADPDVAATNLATFSPGASASAGASAQNAEQVITISGDGNKYTSTINTDNVKNDVGVVGGSNVIKIVQDGNAGTGPTVRKSVDMTLTGDSNKISVNQKSTDNVDTITINSNSTDSILVINQCNTIGGC
jgi:hypothetical protein